MSQALLQQIADKQRKTDYPDFRAGDQVAVNIRIKEGNKERIQKFQGVVIAYQRKNNAAANFTVRKVSGGIGVERTFILHSPFIESIEVNNFGKVRRSKLYYLRDLSAKEARIKPDAKRELKRRESRAEEKSKRGKRGKKKKNQALAAEPAATPEPAVEPEPQTEEQLTNEQTTE
jgi:large subunit ribosomal protein L19